MYFKVNTTKELQVMYETLYPEFTILLNDQLPTESVFRQLHVTSTWYY